MSWRRWQTASERSGGLQLPQDYERAAYRLITQQVLTAADASTRRDYHLVADHIGDFEEALAPLAVTLRHNAQFEYVVAIPRQVLRQRSASKATTLLVLVLAELYHRVRIDGQEDDFGQAAIELPDLQEAYQARTGREFPPTTELRAQLGELERWGVAKRQDLPGDLQPFRLLVHPAIADLVTAEWLHQLDRLGGGSGDEHAAEDQAPDQDAAEDSHVPA